MSRNDTEHLLRSRANAARLRHSLHELRDTHTGSSLASFLDEEGIRGEVEEAARKRVAAIRSLNELRDEMREVASGSRIRPEPASPVFEARPGAWVLWAVARPPSHLGKVLCILGPEVESADEFWVDLATVPPSWNVANVYWQVPKED